MAEPDTASGGDGPRVSLTEAVYETYNSALELAQAFGSPVLEPSCWPADIKETYYSLDRFPGRASYRIGSTRRDGAPICVIGQFEVAGTRRPNGEWYAPRELAHRRGQIGRVGVPTRLQAVVYEDEMAIHLIGYHTDDEIISTVRTLRRVTPN